MKLASIDIGTNTLRLLIGGVDKEGKVTDTLLKREITRLGGGFDGKRLHPDSKARTLKVLGNFAAIIRESSVEKVRASATSVVREAEDGDQFIGEIARETGIEVEVISGEIEGALTLKGVLSALEGRDKMALVFDIGGGSTEYIVAEGGKVAGLKSLNMGVVSLVEKYLMSDPPSVEDISRMEQATDSFLAELRKELPLLRELERGRKGVLVGTAGTITSLAALDQNLAVYDSRKINNYILTKGAVEGLFERLKAMTHNERASIRALEEGRADLIIPGTIIALRTMEEFGFDEMVVSDYGLLEGLLLDLAEEEGPAA